MKRWVGGTLAIFALLICGLWMWNPRDPLWLAMDSAQQDSANPHGNSTDVSVLLLPIRPLTEIQMFVYGWKRADEEALRSADRPGASSDRLYVKTWPRLGAMEMGCFTRAFVDLSFADDWRLVSARIGEAAGYSICY